jgi:hypothetical protein
VGKITRLLCVTCVSFVSKINYNFGTKSFCLTIRISFCSSYIVLWGIKLVNAMWSNRESIYFICMSTIIQSHSLMLSEVLLDKVSPGLKASLQKIQEWLHI